MCGRFEMRKLNRLNVDLTKIYNISLIDLIGEFNINEENIRPTDDIGVLRFVNGEFTLEKMKWGIKLDKTPRPLINSKIETIKEKTYWNNLFNRQRCLIPMTAFYEWQAEGKKKTPYRIFLPDNEIFLVPAIYTLPKDPSDVKRCSLITCEPNKFMTGVHHRMPVILRLEEGMEFLTADTDESLLRCAPYSSRYEMKMEPVILN